MTFDGTLIHTTVRLELDGPKGKKTGTGFFHHFAERNGNFITAIVTNRHVIENGEHLTIRLKERSIDNKVVRGSFRDFTYKDLPTLVMKHPDDTVDLAIIPFSLVINSMSQDGFDVFYRATRKEDIARAPLISDLSDIQPITMIGYPKGIWDDANNLPVVRTGLTSTPLRFDYKGRKEFMIDCACFEGSSGSPIFLFEHGSFYSKTQNALMAGHRVALLGIMYSGQEFPVKAELPDGGHHSVKVPMNLGHIIKASQLDAFEAILQRNRT